MFIVRCLATFVVAGLYFPAAQAWAAAPHYQLAVTLDTAHGEIGVDAVISLPEALAMSGASFLLGGGYKITALDAGANATAIVDSKNAPMPGAQLIVVHEKPDAHGTVDVKLSYAGPLGPTGDDPINEISPNRLELSADSLWYPISTNFNTRFTFDATVRGLPASFVVASPDQVVRREDVIALHRTGPSQDIAFSASPRFQARATGQLQFYANDLTTQEARDYQTYGAKALTFFRAWFGPLPRDKAVIAIVARRNGTGYSRPGYLVVADIGKVSRIDAASYVAHELSHSWWSNADFTGEDYWLVESTAEYSAIRFIESEMGPEVLLPILEKKKIRAAKAGAILGHGRPSGDAVYATGPLLLIDLEKKIGRSKLDRILAHLAQRDTITTADFLKELSDVAGEDAARDFEKQLRG